MNQSATLPYLGSKISLITNAEIRYEGILCSINTKDSTVGLFNVKSFGTEGRRKGNELLPAEHNFEFIVFSGKDIQDLTVSELVPPDDPAIVAINMLPCQGNSPHPSSTAQPQFTVKAPMENMLIDSHTNYYPGTFNMTPADISLMRGPKGNGAAPGRSAPNQQTSVNRLTTPQQGKLGGMGKVRGAGRRSGQPGGISVNYQNNCYDNRGLGTAPWERIPNSGDNMRGHPSMNGGGVGGGFGRGFGGGQYRGRGRGGEMASKTIIGELGAHPNQGLKSKVEKAFDFEEANMMFSKIQLGELKESVEKTPSSEKEEEDGKAPEKKCGAYDKSSFFDYISCETLDKQSGHINRVNRMEQKRKDLTTFGPEAVNSSQRGGRGFRRGGIGSRRGKTMVM